MRILVWEVRVERSLTLKELELISGVSKSEINMIENGQVSPRLSTLEKIADSLDLTVFDLIEL